MPDDVLLRHRSMAGLEIRTLDILDERDRAALSTWVEIQAACARDALGEHASPFTIEEIVAVGTERATDRTPHLALLDGVPVARGMVTLPLHDNTHAAYLIAEVLPDHRRQGIGSALLAALETYAASRGRTTFLVETRWLAGASDTSGEEFGERHGYSAVMTSLQSDLDLGSVGWDALRHRAADAPDGYRIETAYGRLPEAWLEDRAELQGRMSTDAPTEEMDVGPEAWDADRLRESVEVWLATGRQRLEAVARDTRSGRLVGFTYVTVPAGDGGLAIQEDTLVRREDRGHGLGLALKRALLLDLVDRRPDVRTIRTWNATSNTPMLDVNRALGYTPVGYEREWQTVR